jgi:hypothetical protein
MFFSEMASITVGAMSQMSGFLVIHTGLSIGSPGLPNFGPQILWLNLCLLAKCPQQRIVADHATLEESQVRRHEMHHPKAIGRPRDKSAST